MIEITINTFLKKESSFLYNYISLKTIRFVVFCTSICDGVVAVVVTSPFYKVTKQYNNFFNILVILYHNLIY